MSEDSYQLDGTVRITETITHYRFVPRRIYEISHAFDEMSDEEQIKVLKYIVRITGRRDFFKELMYKQSKKDFWRAVRRMEEKNS